MIDIAFSMILFVVTVFVHSLLTRTRPTNILYAKDFIVLALMAIFLLGVILFFLPATSLRLPLVAIVMFVVLVPLYLTIYVSMVLVSPSKRLLLTLARFGEANEEALLKALDADQLIQSRLDELHVSGCVNKKGDVFLLTSQGRLIYSSFLFFQWLSGRKGEG